MSRLERLQKILMAVMLLLALVAAAAAALLLGGRHRQPVPVQATEESTAEPAALTEVLWRYPDHVLLGKPLTQLPLALPDGNETFLESHLGAENTLVVYWGSWCDYCAQQTEILKDAQSLLEAYNTKVLLIDKMDPDKESLEAAEETIASEQIPFDWIVDSDLSVYQALGVHIIPTSFLLDAQGRVLFCQAGRIASQSELEAILSYGRSGPQAQPEEFLRDYLLTAEGGVRMHPYGEAAPSPSGRDVLSESQGLLMEYAADMGDEALFERAYGYTADALWEDGLLRWYGTESGEPAQVNALLDDLRFLRALDAGNRRFGGYDAPFMEAARAIAEKNIDDKGNLVDFYTFSDGSKAGRLTMCYVDGTALELLKRMHPETADSVDRALEILDNAYLGDEFPFYAGFYDYASESYDMGSLNMAEAMITLLHQAERGQLKRASLDWLHRQLAGDGIWARYDIHGNVLPEGAYQSPAVYAIVGLIALECNDTALLTQAVSRMEQFRCFDASSACNGAFASKMEEVSSFDQCTALVLYAKMRQG